MNSQHPGPARPTRRTFLGGSAALGAALAIPAWPLDANAAPRGDPRSYRVSLSVSPFTEAVLGSVSLTDGCGLASSVSQVQQLFRRHGATEVFARVANLRNASLGDAEYGSARAIERAQLARDLGMPLNPELGLWPVYGDIGSQPPPDFSDYPFGRQLFLTEYAYPSGKMTTGSYLWNNTQAGYPQTPGGQFRYLRDLTAIAARAGTIAGIRPWAPDYCVASGGWQPMSLFTTRGTAAPALTSIQTGLQTSTRSLR